MNNPIGTVVIPGFAGTTLSFRGGQGGKTQLWYNPGALLKYTPLAMAFQSDGVTPVPIFGKALFPDGPVNLGIYEPLLTSIANEGGMPYFWGYDWRLNAVSLAQQLATFLATAPLASTFNVVCHSFGGLIAQMAYPLWKSSNGGQTWNQTIYLGTPHGGSYWSALALAGSYPVGSELYLLGQVFGVLVQANRALSSAAQLLLATLGTTVGSWPGIYDLLPNTNGVWSGLDPNAGKLAQLATYSGTPGGQQQQWFDAAAAVLAGLVTAYSAPRPKETCITATGSYTPATFVFPFNPGNFQSYGTVNTGDLTVTVARGTLPVGPSASVLDTNHTGLTSSAQPLNLVNQLLGGGTIKPQVYPNAPAIPVNPSGVPSITFPPTPIPTFLEKSADP